MEAASICHDSSTAASHIASSARKRLEKEGLLISVFHSEDRTIANAVFRYGISQAFCCTDSVAVGVFRRGARRWGSPRQKSQRRRCILARFLSLRGIQRGGRLEPSSLCCCISMRCWNGIGVLIV